MSDGKSTIKNPGHVIVSAMVAVAFGAMAMIIGPVSSKAAMSTSAKNLAGLIAVDKVVGNNSGTSSSSLSDLIVLNGLFGSSTSTTTATKNLAGLIAVDRIVGNNGTAVSDSSGSSLSDLIVLNGVFAPTSTQNQNLAGLLAVDKIVGGGSGESQDLGDLLVLNTLFDP